MSLNICIHVRLCALVSGLCREDPASACDVNVFIARSLLRMVAGIIRTMDKLGPRVFYVDTDSLIFSWKKRLDASNRLISGELTNELE